MGRGRDAKLSEPGRHTQLRGAPSADQMSRRRKGPVVFSFQPIKEAISNSDESLSCIRTRIFSLSSSPTPRSNSTTPERSLQPAGPAATGPRSAASPSACAGSAAPNMEAPTANAKSRPEITLPS